MQQTGKARQIIFDTPADIAPAIIRIACGLILFPHGAQKLLGSWGGYGFEGTMQFFTGTVHLPWALGILIILIEFFGPLLLIAGLGVRIISPVIFLLFTGIMITTPWEHGFFMNWFNNQKGEGFEFDLLMMAMAASLTFSGAGARSLDRYMAHKRQ